MDLCNGCQLCVVRCPDFAIVVEERSSDDGG
jgi:NAD-dependent dihydropyrimidine dehydrogenase PreA subunit